MASKKSEAWIYNMFCTMVTHLCRGVYRSFSLSKLAPDGECDVFKVNAWNDFWVDHLSHRRLSILKDFNQDFQSFISELGSIK